MEGSGILRLHGEQTDVGGPRQRELRGPIQAVPKIFQTLSEKFADAELTVIFARVSRPKGCHYLGLELGSKLE